MGRRIGRFFLCSVVIFMIYGVLEMTVWGLPDPVETESVSEGNVPGQDLKVSEGLGEKMQDFYDGPGQDSRKNMWISMSLGLLAGIVLTSAAAGSIAAGKKRKKQKEKSKKVSIGQVHHIGQRADQQDAFGIQSSQDGILAVVSDGMGGLSDGDKVSRKAVSVMMESVDLTAADPGENPLYAALRNTNQQVIQMLGPDKLYKSGATLLAVIVQERGFHWLAVGDSRIYLYCAGHMFQLNREHIYMQKLIQQGVNGEISLQQSGSDSQKDRLVSFLGMGRLEQIDGSFRPVRLMSGDKLLLMSDGVFNTLSEEEIIQILETSENGEEAADLLERRVIAAGNPRQDNFTCVILDF